MSKTHKKPGRKGQRPWSVPPTKTSLANTIFGQDFLTIVIDEAHHMRNAGNKHTAALRLLQQSRVRLIMTATPLHTAPKASFLAPFAPIISNFSQCPQDIASLARLVGLSHFFTEESFLEEKNDAARLRRAKKLDDDGDTVRAEQVQIVKRLQEHCQGHFLRRTTQSRDAGGQVLLDLPPYEDILGVLTLTKRETTIIQERSESAKAACVMVS